MFWHFHWLTTRDKDTTHMQIKHCFSFWKQHVQFHLKNVITLALNSILLLNLKIHYFVIGFHEKCGRWVSSGCVSARTSFSKSLFIADNDTSCLSGNFLKVLFSPRLYNIRRILFILLTCVSLKVINGILFASSCR